MSCSYKENCQFEMDESKLEFFDGNQYCIFHLPYENNNGEGKKSWSGTQLKYFKDNILIGGPVKKGSENIYIYSGPKGQYPSAKG